MQTYQTANRRKLYEQVIDQIKGMIVQGVYAKGDMLPSEKDLMEMTGVSRITVREALHQLSEAGVIETRKGKGSFVLIDAAALAPADQSVREFCERFLQATDARLLIEPEIARMAAEIATDEDLKRLHKCVTDADMTEHFHVTLADMVHLPIVENWIIELQKMENETSARALIPPAHQKVVGKALEHQHRKIYDAIRSRNPEFAYFYMKEHTLFVKQTYENYFEAFY